MGDFETIPASSLPEKPEEEKKEEVKPEVEAVDWDSDLPAEEPKFVSESEDATRLSIPQQIATEPEVIEAPVIPPSAGQPPKKNRTWIIILIVVLVLLCLCCVAVIAIFFIFDSNTSWDFEQMLRVPAALLI